MELKDTIRLMLSDDYKDRFKAEYYQTKVRYNKIHKMIVKHEAGKLDFKLDNPIDLLKDQEAIMERYLYILEIRALIEGVDLEL